MSTDNSSIAALVVALAAFVIASGQLLQQVFGTADGYRRCQSSVLGPWARYTKLRWVWGQFRYETTFVTPHITVMPTAGQTALSKEHQVFESKDAVDVEFGFSSQPEDWAEAKASWVYLIGSLVHVQRRMGGIKGLNVGDKDSALFQNTKYWWPIYRRKKRSWDFMPPDVIRPFASTTVHDIAIIANRLGLRWSDFNPTKGIMVAEGAGQTFTSTVVRSIGLMLEYNRSWSLDPMVRSSEMYNPVFSPSPYADAFGFGVIFWAPSSKYVKTREKFEVGTIQDLRNAFRNIEHNCPDDPILKAVRFADCLIEGSNEAPGLLDLLSIASPPISIPSTQDEIISRPFPSELRVELHGATLKVFHHRLKIYIEGKGSGNVSKDVLWVKDACSMLRAYFQWEGGTPVDVSMTSGVAVPQRDFYELAKEIFHRADSYKFDDEMTTDDDYTPKLFRKDYKRLAIRQVFGAISAYRAALDTHEMDGSMIKTRPCGVGRDVDSQVKGEAMHLLFPSEGSRWFKDYFDNDSLPEEVMVEGWLIMMMRGFCWVRLHKLDNEGPTVPSKYLNSQMPLYIG